MTTFYICRHGESENNKRKRLMGWLDTPLTEEGKQNAKSSAAKLRSIQFDKIVSSDLGRAFQTAYLISRELNYTSEIETYKDLREANYGDLANMPYTAYPELSPVENATYIPPRGESLTQMQDRAIACINAIGSNNDDKTILIVAHDGTINAVKARFSQKNMGIEDTTHNSHDFVAQFTFTNNEITSFSEV